jgi:hypothetical protein
MILDEDPMKTRNCGSPPVTSRKRRKKKSHLVTCFRLLYDDSWRRDKKFSENPIWRLPCALLFTSLEEYFRKESYFCFVSYAFVGSFIQNFCEKYRRDIRIRQHVKFTLENARRRFEPWLIVNANQRAKVRVKMAARMRLNVDLRMLPDAYAF